MPRRSNDKKIAVAYIRASKEEQLLTADSQRAAIEAWAARLGVTVVSWHIDQGVRSVTPLDERPGLLEAVASLKASKAGVPVVARRDRLARDVVLAAMLERLVDREGAGVESADGVGNGVGPEAQLMRTIVDAFAQYERALIRARTKAALAAKKARGQRVGGVPYGWTLAGDGKTLVQAPKEQAIIALAKKLKDGGMSQQKIVRELEQIGVRSRHGTPFIRNQVVRMLAQPAPEAPKAAA